MRGAIIALAATIFIVGTILIGLSIPLVQGRVSPNSIYGFRTSKTLADPSTWYAANRFSGKVSIVVGAVMMLLAALLLLLARYTGLGPATLTALGLAFEIVPPLILALVLFLYHRNL